MNAGISLPGMRGVKVSENLFSKTGPSSGLTLVLILAFSLRLAFLFGNVADHPGFFFQDPATVEAEISSSDTPYMNPFGFEASNVAHALVCTDQGYASPFGGETGPTAWIAPGVVSLYALSFTLWGCFTFESILFTFVIALAVSLITTVVVFRIGSRVGGDSDVGLLAALFFALLPFEAWIFQIAGHLDFNLQVLWFAVLLLAVLRAMDRDRRPSGFELGAVSSVAAIFNPGFLLCTAVGLVFVLHGRSRRGMGRMILLVGLAHVLILGPVVAIQSVRLGGFVPVKSNAGFEIFLGDTPEAHGLLHDPAFQTHHPSQSVKEFSRYRAAGELRYVKDAKQKFAESFVLSDFLRKSALRTFHFFLGYQIKPWDSSVLAIAIKAGFWLLPTISLLAFLAIRRGRLDAAEFVVVLFTLSYAVPYLLTGVMERYRLPMVSFVAVTLALVTQRLIESRREREQSRSAEAAIYTRDR